MEIRQKIESSLRPYQIEGSQYLRANRTALLYDDMGLGKTLQVLASLEEDAKTLVVAPASVRTVWEDEINKWRPDLCASIVNRGKFRWPEKCEVVILSCSGLPLSVHGCPSGVRLVSDEVHNFKNPKAKRTQQFVSMKNSVLRFGGSVWGITGTPLYNQPLDLWNTLNVLELAKPVFGTFQSFVRMFRGWKSPWGGYQWPRLNQEETTSIRTLLSRRCMGRTKCEASPHMPRKTYNSIRVPIKKSDSSVLNKCLKMFLDLGWSIDDAGRAIRPDGGVATTDDLPILMSTISTVRKLMADAKILCMLDYCRMWEEAREPLVVFSAHRGPIESLAKNGYTVVTGDMPKEERKKNIAKFQTGESTIIGGTSAMCEGVTLTKSSHMLFVDRFWSMGQNMQAEDRIHRIGQENTCMYTDLVLDHKIDRMVCSILGKKRIFVQAVKQ